MPDTPPKRKLEAKIFPWNVRRPLWEMAKKYGKQKFSLVAIWDYMFWRSGRDNLFVLAESLVIHDLGIPHSTWYRVISILQREGWLKKGKLRNEGGQFDVREWIVVPLTTVASTVVGSTVVGSTVVGSCDSTVVVQSGSIQNSSVTNPEELVSRLVGSVPSLRSVTTGGASASLQHPVSESKSKGKSKSKPSQEVYWRMTQGEVEGFMAKHEEQIGCLAGLLAEAMGISYFEREPLTDHDLCVCLDVTEGYEYVVRVYLWSQSQKFWKGRVVSLHSLATCIANQTEKGLMAQYNRDTAKKQEAANA